MFFQVTDAHTNKPIHVNATTVASVYSDEYRNNHGGRYGAYVRDDVTRIMHTHGIVHAVDEPVAWVMEQIRNILRTMVVSYQMSSADSLENPTPLNPPPPQKEPANGHVTDRHDG